MPELPEVETVRRQLIEHVVGKTIRSVEVFHAKSANQDEDFEDALIGKTIAGIDRVGKLLIFSFQKQADLYMLAHLKMTGQFFYIHSQGASGGGHTYQQKEILTLPNLHTRIHYSFSDDSSLYFNDMRIFGYNKLVNAQALQKAKEPFGPEPNSPEFSISDCSKLLRARKGNIKALLLNQSIIAGLGNIYVDETLFKAKVLPTRSSDTLTTSEAKLLCEAMSAILKKAIEVGGTTFQHFKDTGGKHGNYRDYLQVFGRQGQQCTLCGTTIQKTRVAGRGTHFCPNCQR